MPSQTSLTIACQCNKQQYPLVVDGQTEAVLELVCPFSHSGDCGFPHVKQQITIPDTARPGEVIYKNL